MVDHSNCDFIQCEYPDRAVERGVAPPKENDSTRERETGGGRIPAGM